MLAYRVTIIENARVTLIVDVGDYELTGNSLLSLPSSYIQRYGWTAGLLLLLQRSKLSGILTYFWFFPTFSPFC